MNIIQLIQPAKDLYKDFLKAEKNEEFEKAENILDQIDSLVQKIVSQVHDHDKETNKTYLTRATWAYIEGLNETI